jgi:hypothetical protein
MMMNPLTRLEQALAGGPLPHDLVQISGQVCEVTPAGLTFDLPMVSAVTSVRASGTISWATPGS